MLFKCFNINVEIFLQYCFMSVCNIVFSSQQRIIKGITPETATEIPYGDIHLNAI